METSLSIGLMNSIRTDNVFINIILSTIIVALIGAITQNVKTLINKLLDIADRLFRYKTHKVTIKY